MYSETNDFGVGYALGRDANNNYDGMMGGNNFWWVIILFLFGWGGFGGNGFGRDNLDGLLTRSDLCQDLNFNNLESGVRGVQNGLCDGFYAMNTGMLNGFAGVQQTLCQGFGGLNTAILTGENETQGAIANLGSQLQNCCCNLRSDINGVNFNMAQNTCALQNTMNNNTRDIIASQQCGTQRILDFLCNEKISGLQAENAALTAQLSQNAQTSTLINTLRPIPVPAYSVGNFYGNYGYGFNDGCGRNGFGFNNGCGCC